MASIKRCIVVVHLNLGRKSPLGNFFRSKGSKGCLINGEDPRFCYFSSIVPAKRNQIPLGEVLVVKEAPRNCFASGKDWFYQMIAELEGFHGKVYV